MIRIPILMLAVAMGLFVQVRFVSADVYRDPVFGFQVAVPEGWRTQERSDGQARMLWMQSPDGKARAQIEAIHLARGDTLNDLRQSFIATAFPEASFVGAQPEVHANLSGEVAAWTVDIDGRQMVVGGFFAVDGPVGYILWSLTARADYDTYSGPIDAVFNTFTPGTLIGTYSEGAPQGDAGGAPSGRAGPLDQSNVPAGLVAEAHPELGFVFLHDDAWHPDQPQRYSLRVGLMEYPARMRPSIVIEALAGAAYPTLQAGVDDLKSQLVTMPAIQFDQDGPQQVQNMSEQGVMMDGWSFGASYLLGDVPFRQITYLFKRKNPSVYYAIYVTGPKDILLRHQPEMLGMLQAIQIIPFR